MTDDAKKNVEVHCLVCWTTFVTSRDSYEKGEVECPNAECCSTAIRLKVADEEDDD